jgi:hypothetical protein
MHHCELNVAFVVNQLGSKSVGKTANTVLCAAVRGLQRNTSICECRSDLDNRATIPWLHETKRSHRPINGSEVSNLGHPPVFFGIHLLKRRENRHHGIVDPNVNRTELVFNLKSCGIHLFVVGHVGRDYQGTAAKPFYVRAAAFQSGRTARQQGDMRAVLCKLARRRSSDACGRTGNDNNTCFFDHAKLKCNWLAKIPTCTAALLTFAVCPAGFRFICSTSVRCGSTRHR